MDNWWAKDKDGKLVECKPKEKKASPVHLGVIKPDPYEDLKVEDFTIDVKPIVIYNREQLEDAINEIGYPAILKTLYVNEEAGNIIRSRRI